MKLHVCVCAWDGKGEHCTAAAKKRGPLQTARVDCAGCVLRGTAKRYGSVAHAVQCSQAPDSVLSRMHSAAVRPRSGWLAVFTCTPKAPGATHPSHHPDRGTGLWITTPRPSKHQASKHQRPEASLPTGSTANPILQCCGAQPEFAARPSPPARHHHPWQTGRQGGRPRAREGSAGAGAAAALPHEPGIWRPADGRASPRKGRVPAGPLCRVQGRRSGEGGGPEAGPGTAAATVGRGG